MSNWRLTVRENFWILIVLAVFGTVYACSLTFVYIDPDDAVSIEYHALGRNDAVQPPFERFQMGMDLLLGFLPQNEPVVRVTAMTASAAATIGLVALVLLLCFDALDVCSPWLKAAIAFALLLAAPELIYIGLLYTPMVLGMCCAVAAHVLLRRTLRRSTARSDGLSKQMVGQLSSAVLMGVAGLFRWDILVYGFVISLDVVLDPQKYLPLRYESYWSRVRAVLVWGIVALFVWLGIEIIALDLTKAISELISAAKETAAEMHVRDIRILGAHLVFFSPAFTAIGLAGWISLARQKGGMSWMVFILTILAVVWPFWSTPKEIMIFIPFFVMLFVYGFTRLLSLRRLAFGESIIKICIAVLLLLPWLFGVHISFGDSAWGPGFELASFSHPVGTGTRDVRVVAGAGAAFPTNEGVRPVFGHGAVLLCGKWREFANGQFSEIDRSFRLAVDRSLPYLVAMHYDAFQVNCATRNGFMTRDPERRGYNDKPILRHFRNATGTEQILVRIPGQILVQDSTNILQIIRETGKDKIVCWSEPGQMRVLYKTAPDAFIELGPRTAVVDLRKLLGAVVARQTRESHNEK